MTLNLVLGEPRTNPMVSSKTSEIKESQDKSTLPSCNGAWSTSEVHNLKCFVKSPAI